MRLQQMNKLAFSSCFGLVCMGTLSAQEVSHFSFELGAGFTQTVGNTGRYLNDGWNLQGGVGYNFSPYIGVAGRGRLQFAGLQRHDVRQLAGIPGGDVNMFSATIDPIVHLTPRSHFDLYAIGGGGLYHWYEQFSAPAGTCDPFRHRFFPACDSQLRRCVLGE